MNELNNFYFSIRAILSHAHKKAYNITNFEKIYAVCSQFTRSQDFLFKKYSYERKELAT
jgi:UDP-2,3-diacylglucosamine pyrophosphatase LpxH